MGGLYKEQGMDDVKKWLRPLLTSDIKESYEIVRREYLLPTLTASPADTPQMRISRNVFDIVDHSKSYNSRKDGIDGWEGV